MDFPHEMNTVSQIMEKLRLEKKDNEFRWCPDGFTVNKGKYYQPSDLEIIKIYRFEGITDPGDTSILYIIEGSDGMIGYSLDAYGVYSSHDDEEGYDNFIRQIPVARHEDQMLFKI